MPVVLYRWYFGAYGLRGFKRSILSFAGIKPIRECPYGLRAIGKRQSISDFRKSAS